MRADKAESWALDVIARVQSRQPVEDSLVELKSQFIPPEQAARRLAGHANAARGQPLLWLIGVDGEAGVVTGANYAELSSWFRSVKAQFDGLAPRLTDYCVPVNDKTVVALVFETDRPPFVVKNPFYGKQRGDPAALEVPWREGSDTRSATRADLLCLLSPLQELLSFEVLGAYWERGPAPQSKHLNPHPLAPTGI